MRHYPEQNPVLRDLLPTITTPTLIVAGRDDDLVPWSNNQYLDDLLPNSEIHPALQRDVLVEAAQTRQVQSCCGYRDPPPAHQRRISK